MGQKPSKQPQVDPRYLAPQKLHCFNEVDLRKLRRLIKDRKLAPCCPGVDSESRELEECPICFLQYPSLNRAVCCHKPICTECFLQVKALKAGLCPMCPYCKADFSIYFHGPASAEQKLKSEAEDNEQALALKRSRQGEQQGSSHNQAQQLPAVPCQALPLEQASQTAPASLAKILPQTDNTGLDLWDHLPHDFFLAGTMQSEGDLDEAMLMQGISASLEHPTQFTTRSSSVPAPRDSCHTSCVPALSHPKPAVHAAQQASRGSSGPALAPTESVQPRVFTGTVVGHSTGWQDPSETLSSSQAGAGLQIRGRRTAAESHSIAVSTSNNRTLMPPSGSQSDAIVHLSVKSADTKPNSHSLTPSTPSDVQSSSRDCPQVGSPHKSSATSSGCIPSILPLSSSARKSGRTQIGAGDTLAGFLQKQAKPPHVDPQAILPQTASGTHELFVGMVTADFAFAPSPGQQQCSSSNETETQHNARQGPTTSPNCPPSRAASSSVQGSVGVSGTCSGCTAGDCEQEQRGASMAVPQSMEVSVGDLTDGAVMLQNPDGSVQYVVLTSDEQRAVQLSMQAKRSKQAGTAETSAYQVECSPEDQAVQAAIAEGDAILRRLYQAPQDVQQHPVGACSASLNTPDTADRSTRVQHADPMLKRMEEADAKLRGLYSST